MRTLHVLPKQMRAYVYVFICIYVKLKITVVFYLDTLVC